MEKNNISIAAPIAPEDIRPGDYITILHVVLEILGDFCVADTRYTRIEPVQIQCLPFGEPPVLEVDAVCLPYVLARDAKGAPRTLDIRRHRLARLTESFGRQSFKRARRATTKPDCS